jgi:hypothetical protein
LNKSLVGSESKDVDMGAYIVAAEALRDAFDCVVVIIHHCGYDETHPRGHTSLTGAVDAEFEVVRENMLVTVKNVTMRDGPEGFEIRSLTEAVEVGEDVRGKVLTSLVITQTDAPAAVGKKRTRGRPNVAAPILIDALRTALAERGSPFRPPGGKATEHVVSEREVRSRFDTGYPAGEADAEKAADATSEAYRRALHGAVADGVIGKGGPRYRRRVLVQGADRVVSMELFPRKCPRKSHEMQNRELVKPPRKYPTKFSLRNFVGFVGDATKIPTKVPRKSKVE